MTTVTVRYHHEVDGWWAESPDVAGFTAAGATLSEVRELTKDGLPFYLETDDVEFLEEVAHSTGAVVDVRLMGEDVHVSVESSARSSGGSTVITRTVPRVSFGAALVA